MNHEIISKLSEVLATTTSSELPKVVARHRIDGPGSSLDLPLLQEAFWRIPCDARIGIEDKSLAWSRSLPRTVGITINTGTAVTAHPFAPGHIGVVSKDYSWEFYAKADEVPVRKELWLLKVMSLFGLHGIKFVLSNLNPHTCSSGLGGSATATAAVCILANELSGRPFNREQLVTIASRLEQSYGVSITGTQEQSNVLFGGVTDYLWQPWGRPGGFADTSDRLSYSFRTELVTKEGYSDLEDRFCIFHSGLKRSSTDVNAVWLRRLSDEEGYLLHREMPALAYQFREGLRTSRWPDVLEAINSYREVRSVLCPDYMAGSEQIHLIADTFNCGAFPLGAGGGGATLVFGAAPEDIIAARKALTKKQLIEIPVTLMERGHDCYHLERVSELWSNAEADLVLQQELAA